MVQRTFSSRVFRYLGPPSIGVAALLFPGMENPTAAQTPKPLTVEWKTKLKFAKAASDIDIPGAVIIDPVANSRTVTGGAFDFGGTWKRGKLTIRGEKNAYVNVYLPSSFTMTNANGNHSVSVTNLTMNKVNPLKLNNKGKATVYVGGTMQVAANQKNKNYAGGFTVSVEYN